MASVEKHYSTLFLVIASFILIIAIFKWIDYLTSNSFIMECFKPGPVQEESVGATSHTVNLPLTTTYSCTNFCGPTARCSITGQQCSAAIAAVLAMYYGTDVFNPAPIIPVKPEGYSFEGGGASLTRKLKQMSKSFSSK